MQLAFELDGIEPMFVQCADGTDVHLLAGDGRCERCGLPILRTVVAA